MCKYCLYAGIDFRSINAQTRRIDYVISPSLLEWKLKNPISQNVELVL